MVGFLLGVQGENHHNYNRTGYRCTSVYRDNELRLHSLRVYETNLEKWDNLDKSQFQNLVLRTLDFHVSSYFTIHKHAILTDTR